MIELSIERFIITRFSENNGEDLYEYFSNPKVLEFEPFKLFTKDEACREAKRRVGDEKGNPIWKDTCEYEILKSEYMSKGHYLYNNGHALLYATMSC